MRQGKLILTDCLDRILAKDKLRIGVVGSGKMGRNHLRVASLLNAFNLVGTFDPLTEKAEEAANAFGCRAFPSEDELLSAVDAVVIATPTENHHAAARRAIDQGRHCLVEKPFTLNAEQAEDLIGAAKRQDVCLAVGHIERFNPAVIKLKSILETGHSTIAFDARRMGFDSARVDDINVVMDLMVHDIDVVTWLADSEIANISAHGYVSPGGRTADHVVALVEFKSGTIGSLTASRVSQNKARTLQVTAEHGFFDLNYINQDLEIYRQENINEENWQQGDYVLDISVGRVLLNRTEPLMNELSDFADAIRQHRLPGVDGVSALNTMRIAWRVHDLISHIEPLRDNDR